MSTGLKPLLEYKREEDCWSCSCCETENNISSLVCSLCATERNERCTILKKWSPITRTAPNTTTTARPAGGTHTYSSAPTSTPYAPKASYSAEPVHTPRTSPPKPATSSNKSNWMSVILTAVAVLVAVLLYANAEEPNYTTEKQNIGYDSYVDSADYSTELSFENVFKEDLYVL